VVLTDKSSGEVTPLEIVSSELSIDVEVAVSKIKQKLKV